MNGHFKWPQHYNQLLPNQNPYTRCADQKKARNQQTKTVNFEGGETRVNWQLIELGKHSVDQEEKWLPSSPPWPA